MMKSVLLLSVISVLSVTSLAASAESLKPFEFKGVTAGVEMDPKSVGKCRSLTDVGLVKCDAAVKSVAGIGEGEPKIYFYNNRLHKVLYRFDTNEFDKLNKSLNQKYGGPCEQSNEEVSIGGKVIDNPTVSWCFETGKLTLKAMDKGMLHGSLIYIDKNKLPTQGTLVDF